MNSQVLNLPAATSEIQYCSVRPRQWDAAAVSISMGYRRCADFDGTDEPGQDFVAAEFQDDYIVAVVADGVSQSFYGHLAAKYVSEAALDCLWKNRHAPPSQTKMEEALAGARLYCRQAVESFPLPPGLPSIVVEALEEKRETGSQACLAALLYCRSTGMLHLYQIGDVLANIDGKIFLASDSDNRWSSSPQHEVHLSYQTVLHPSLVILHSDGVPTSAKVQVTPILLDRERFQTDATEWARRDDVSFFAAQLRSVRHRNKDVGNDIAALLLIMSLVFFAALLWPSRRETK